MGSGIGDVIYRERQNIVEVFWKDTDTKAQSGHGRHGHEHIDWRFLNTFSRVLSKERKVRNLDSRRQEDARGRKAAFEIELKDLKTRELPELDDEFAKQASEQETLADLRKDLEQRLKDDAERRQTSNRRDALVAALVEQLEVELPEALIQQESRNLLEQTAAQFAQQGMDVKSLFTPDLVRNLMQNSRPEAEERLRRSFALTALAEAEDIKLDDKDVDAKIKEVKKELSADAKIDPERLRQAVMDDLMQDRLMGWLEENSTLTEKAPAADDSKAAAKKKPAAKKTAAKSKSKADAKD